MVQVINGLKIANDFCDSIRARTDELKARGVTPRLALITGNEEYINSVVNFAKIADIEVDVYKLHEKTSPDSIADTVRKLNVDNNTHGISLRAPLAKRASFRELINLINAEKDVEGLTTLNQGRLFSGEPGIVPCAPLGVLHLIKTIHDDISGLRAVVLGRSSIVGRPLAQLLLNSNCSVTLLHSYSRDLEDICKHADILVSAIGQPNFVTSGFIKKGATVIDVGINKISSDNGEKIIGDVNFDDASEIAGAITPVPNGVWPMTSAYVMHNTLKLACCY